MRFSSFHHKLWDLGVSTPIVYRFWSIAAKMSSVFDCDIESFYKVSKKPFGAFALYGGTLISLVFMCVILFKAISRDGFPGALLGLVYCLFCYFFAALATGVLMALAKVLVNTAAITATITVGLTVYSVFRGGDLQFHIPLICNIAAIVASHSAILDWFCAAFTIFALVWHIE